MNEFLIPSETTVADLLKKFPQTARLFITQKTACVGCYMAGFCTLQDVLETYDLDRDSFLAELNEVIKNPIQIK
jgi:hybrid cluster-associated redox disulfide protein